VPVRGSLAEHVAHLRREADLDLLQGLEDHSAQPAIELVEVQRVLDARTTAEGLGASTTGRPIGVRRRFAERIRVRL
jgi:hypothetical protein